MKTSLCLEFDFEVECGKFSRKLAMIVDDLARYFRLLLALEWDFDSIDRLARSLNESEVYDTLYRAFRRRENLVEYIKDQVLKNAKEEEKKDIENSLKFLSKYANEGLIDCVRGYINAKPDCIKAFVKYVASKALASTPEYLLLREVVERRGG